MSNSTAHNYFIVENGSDTIKYGFSSGKPSFLPTNYFLDKLGDINESNEIAIIKRGSVKNWNELEKLYDKIFKEDENVLNSTLIYIIEPTNSFIDKEKFCKLMFEKYSINSINISNQSVLSLLSNGLVNGCVLNSGHSYSSAVSVSDGNLIKHSIEFSNVGGNDITQFLMKNLNLPDKYKKNRVLYQSIKEQYCQIKTDAGADIKQQETSMEFELPDGSKVDLEEQKINLASIIPFETYIVDCDLPSVSDILIKSISKTQIDFRKTLYSNILLTGGNTLCKGFVDRFKNELKEMVPKTIRTKVNAEKNRKYASWTGAKMLADLDNLNVITKQDYEDAGSKLITKIFP